MRLKFIIPAFCLFIGSPSCTPQDGSSFFGASSQDKAKESSSCPLPSGKYPVQSVTHNTSVGHYEIFLLDTPTCVSSPARFEQVKLARLNSEENKPVARLDYIQNEDPTLFLTENFKIDLIGMVSENGQPPREESSAWMPFLAGAAGAAVAGMAMNALFNKPQYYMPPPQKPGSAYSRGFGSQGETYKSAVNNYQKKFNAMPPSAQNSGKIKTKPYASQSSSQQQRMNPQKSYSSAPKKSPARRSFLRRR
ncbi:MAG: hypothetical protein K2X39_06060 [Silvanigrellaceae bacterium]|nr:hypothetical protein [Silvanigrellaceae bacterium]